MMAHCAGLSLHALTLEWKSSSLSGSINGWYHGVGGSAVFVAAAAAATFEAALPTRLRVASDAKVRRSAIFPRLPVRGEGDSEKRQERKKERKRKRKAVGSWERII